MKKKPATLPRGYRTCTASLAVADVPAALAFYQTAFGAEIRTCDSDQQPGFASIKIGTSMLFVTAGWSAYGHQPAGFGAASPVAHHMYVEDVDAVLEAATAAGATVISAAEDTYWGERCATVADPFGHLWTLATRLENLTSEAIEERRNAWLGLSQDDPAGAALDAAAAAD
ncbi:VOC family protein [Ruegeria sp.]|uniref:VOC family protein n=1 Tax=Ruegeria sp. TaxID=1879320 RepID=UPI002317189F|nr:VOC family protein [Ruegeria sp.]MDA7963445.1 VOC family protein [Ruegeria sp.]